MARRFVYVNGRRKWLGRNREQAIAAGLCGVCASRALVTKTMCAECANEHRLDMAAKREAQKSNDKW